MDKTILYGGGFVALVALLLAGAWFSRGLSSEGQGATALLSTSGLHWHAKLSIRINGEEAPIPANLGLIGRHSPIHTHDDEPGLIHLEFEGVVRADDTELGDFFAVWGKRFDASGIFEHEAPPGTLSMRVNGEPNAEFESYRMRDGDVIEITYE